MSDLFTLDLDGMAQSAVDLADPTRLVFDYVRRIGDVLDRCPPGPLRVLHIGGAAMTLPRYVAATRPRSAQIVLEPDEAMIARVRAEAPLPARSGIKVRPVDGLTGLPQIREASQDVVILDAFRDAVVPAELTTGSFAAQVRRVLAPTGLLVANIADTAPFGLTRDVIAALRAHLGSTLAVGAEPATAKAKRPGNLIVLAGAVPHEPFGNPSPTAYRVFGGCPERLSQVSDSFGGGTVR